MNSNEFNHNYPQELAEQNNFVVFRLEKGKDDKIKKVPYSPHTTKKCSVTDPTAWSDLQTAIATSVMYGFNGIGYVFTGGIIGIDLDNCLDENGNPNEIAADILSRLPDTYIEISPSGQGLHIFLKGEMPTGGNRRDGVEMYSTGRYFTMTGKKYKNCVDKIADDNGAIAWIHKKYIKSKSTAKSAKTTTNQGKSSGVSSLSDSELLSKVRASNIFMVSTGNRKRV